MRVHLSEKLLEVYSAAPQNIRKIFDKQLIMLARDIKYPSLHAKKYDEVADVWQARINKNWRFYFVIENDAYVIIDLIRHPK